VEHDRTALLRAQRPQGSHEVDHRLGQRRRIEWFLGLALTAGFQLTGGDPEGGPPDPSIRGLDRVAPTERLCERLGRRVAGQLRIARERGEGTPELAPLLPPDPLDDVARLGSHTRSLNLHA
jgi:hypothetical protein